MRRTILLSLAAAALAITAASGVAAAQVTADRGEAGYFNGNASYPAPVIPLVNTPTYSWPAPAFDAAGASDSALGTSAGARNSTLQAFSENGSETSAAQSSNNNSGFASAESFSFDGGVAESPSSRSVLQIRAEQEQSPKAARTYTNDDIQKLSDSNGSVKYEGKNEHL